MYALVIIFVLKESFDFPWFSAIKIKEKKATLKTKEWNQKWKRWYKTNLQHIYIIIL